MQSNPEITENFQKFLKGGIFLSAHNLLKQCFWSQFVCLRFIFENVIRNHLTDIIQQPDFSNFFLHTFNSSVQIVNFQFFLFSSVCVQFCYTVKIWHGWQLYGSILLKFALVCFLSDVDSNYDSEYIINIFLRDAQNIQTHYSLRMI